MSAQVLDLPVPQRSCVECVHYRASERDTRCSLFEVQILSEKAAARDCEAFEVEESS
jgi:hypothetical protein